MDDLHTHRGPCRRGRGEGISVCGTWVRPPGKRSLTRRGHVPTVAPRGRRADADRVYRIVPFSADRLIVTADANESRNVMAVGDGYWLRRSHSGLFAHDAERSSQTPFFSPSG